MIGALVLLALLADPEEPPAAELPTDIGSEAADRFEDYVNCVGGEIQRRRADRRPAGILAEEVRAACEGRHNAAAEALAAAYTADPTLLCPGEDPRTKADSLLRTWDVRIEWVLDHAGAPRNGR